MCSIDKIIYPASEQWYRPLVRISPGQTQQPQSAKKGSFDANSSPGKNNMKAFRGKKNIPFNGKNRNSVETIRYHPGLDANTLLSD
jgi:hypothetical protein